MKIWPSSILSRTAWVLGIGFALMIIDGIFVSTQILAWQEGSRGDGYVETAMKMKTLSHLVGNLPPELRVTFLSYYKDPNLNVSWGEENQVPVMGPDWGTRQAREHLIKAFNGSGIIDLHIGHPYESGQPNDLDKNRIIVTVQLADKSWMQFDSRTPHTHELWVWSIVAVISVFLVTIYILALLVSRQIVRPLRLFSNAALRFSTNLDAEPLANDGPREFKGVIEAFNTMQDRVRRFVNERMQILAAISHDLRTPLTRLRLRFENWEEPQQKQKALADLQEMQAMLDSTLAFARDDASDEGTSRVNLNTLLYSVCDDSVDTGADVSCDIPDQEIQALCKPIAMRRALQNLLDNAIKYAGAVEVSLGTSADDIVIEVKDRGPGIDDSEKEHVFSPFYRVEKSRNRETGGTGLGLTVARTIARAHGGDIRLSDREGGGLVVSLRIPKPDALELPLCKAL